MINDLLTNQKQQIFDDYNKFQKQINDKNFEFEEMQSQIKHLQKQIDHKELIELDL